MQGFDPEGKKTAQDRKGIAGAGLSCQKPGRHIRTHAGPMALNTNLSLLSSRNTATASAVSLFLVVQPIQLRSQATGAQKRVVRAVIASSRWALRDRAFRRIALAWRLVMDPMVGSAAFSMRRRPP